MNRKTYFKAIIIGGLCLYALSSLFFTPVAVQAVDLSGAGEAVENILSGETFSEKTYTPLAPIPGLTDQKSFTTGTQGNVDLGKFLASAYTFLVAAASAIAVLMIISAGAQKIFGAASASGVSEANDRIRNAIYGLLLILFSWIIIFTINPEALKFNAIFDGSNNGNNPGEGGGAEPQPDPTYSFTYTRLEIGSDQNRESSPAFKTIEQCNIERDKRRAIKGPTYDANESACLPSPLQVGDEVYSFTYNTYTSPQNIYVAQGQEKNPRDIITQTYSDANPERCESQRQILASREVKTYLPIQNSCEKTLFGNYYFNYVYGADPDRQEYKLIYPSENFCNNVLKTLDSKTEKVATISGQCNPTKVTEEFLKGTTRDIYCTNLIKTLDKKESSSTECFLTKTECIPVLAEKLKEQRSYYSTTSCQPN